MYNTLARITWLDCFDPNGDTNKNVFQGLNALARVDYQTGEVQYFSPGPNCLVQEPAFSPRHPGAPEGDGFLITLIDNMNTGRNELVSGSISVMRPSGLTTNTQGTDHPGYS